MKIKMDLQKTIIAISAIIAMIFGSLFLIMYANNKNYESNIPVEAATINSFVITPDNMGKQGELMFAYIGENNYIYNLDDESKPLIEQPASLLLYASDDTVLYVAPAETDANHLGRESIIQELQIGEHENNLYTIATVSIDPCWSSNDEVIYFVKDDQPKHLYTFEPLTSTTELAAEFEQNILGLRISSDGLLVSVDTGEEKLYVPLSKSLTEAYYNCQGSRVLVCEQYDLILSPSGELYYRWLGSNEAVKISDNVVVAKGYQDNEIFFVQNNDSGKVLNAYYVSENIVKELAKLPDNIMSQLTVSANHAFLIDSYNVVYKYDIDLNEFYAFSQIKEEVKNPMISAFDYRLMVYDLSREMDQTFAYAIDAMVTPGEEVIDGINAYLDKMIAESAELAYFNMAMGTIGSEVQSLQASLLNLGYINSVPTGIFDVSTTVAIQQLQFDLGLDQTGIADNELLSKIFENSLQAKTGYSTLSSSSKGVLVRDLQARLRTLGYSVKKVTGEMDKATIESMRLFTSKNGIDYDGGIIQSSVLELLFGPEAVLNTERLPLEFGDCHQQASELNQRLKDLGYLAGSVNPTFDQKTIEAIQLVNDVNNYSGKDILSYIYGDNIIECPTNLRPKALDDTVPSNPNQVISDRQLKIIRKWLTKQFAVNHTEKQAIKRLQMQLVRLEYLNRTDVSMIYDQNTFDAIVAFQKANDLPSDGIASKNTLTTIFASEINRSVESEEQ